MENTNDKQVAVQMPEPEYLNGDGTKGITVENCQAYGDAKAEEARREAAERIIELEELLSGARNEIRMWEESAAQLVEEAAAQADGWAPQNGLGVWHQPNAKPTTLHRTFAASTAQPTPPDDERARVLNENAKFEAWAKDEGLIQESFGIRSTSSACAIAQKAWDAGRAALRHPPVTNGGELPPLPEDTFLGNNSSGDPIRGYRVNTTIDYGRACFAAGRGAAVRDYVSLRQSAAQPTQAGAEPARVDGETYTMKQIEDACYGEGIRYGQFKALQVALFAARQDSAAADKGE